MVHTIIRRATSVASAEIESRIRDLHRIQKGASGLITPWLTELTSSQQLLDNIDRVAKSHYQGKDSKTVFDEIFDSKLSEEDKKPLRLLQEAQTFSIAGTETTRASPLHLMKVDFRPRS